MKEHREFFSNSEKRWYVELRDKGSGKTHLESRAVYVWEQRNGKLPNGCEIHHINHDRTDDRIENLQCIPRHEHRLLHEKLQEDHKK
jgi:hypothetical protein